jgi:hypothetical protein
LGIRTVHGFLDLVGLMEGALLDWSGFAKGFCTGVLGRTANFQVVANGSQHHRTYLGIVKIPFYGLVKLSDNMA